MLDANSSWRVFIFRGGNIKRKVGCKFQNNGQTKKYGNRRKRWFVEKWHFYKLINTAWHLYIYPLLEYSLYKPLNCMLDWTLTFLFLLLLSGFTTIYRIATLQVNLIDYAILSVFFIICAINEVRQHCVGQPNSKWWTNVSRRGNIVRRQR